MSPATLLLATAVLCFFPIGIKTIAMDGMILGKFGAWMDASTEKLPEWLRKPLWTCPRCMVPYWGFGAAILVIYAPWYVYALPLIVTAIGIQDTLDK